MAQLRFENPAITEEFDAALRALGAPLPWDWHDGALVDASGRLIAEFYASRGKYIRSVLLPPDSTVDGSQLITSS